MLSTEVIIIIFIVVIFVALLFKYVLPVAIPAITHIFMGGAQRLILTVQDPMFSEIKSGKKTVEARVGKPDIYKKNIGSKVKISNPGVEKIYATIKDVRHYDTLEEFIKKEGIKKVAPGAKSDKEAIAAHLAVKNKAGEAIYDEARVKERGGITAIELQI